MNKYTSAALGFFFIIISFCLIEGCSKSQTNAACIGSITTPATVGSPVTFVSCNRTASAYTWNFGDGNSATGDSVLHTYTTAGTYRGSLTVVSGGKTATNDFSVTISPIGWTFRGGAFSIDSALASQTGATLTAVGTTASGTARMIIKFYPFPTVSGNYLIINANNGFGASNELFVVLSRDSAGVNSLYGSTGSDTTYAPVAVSGGRISIVIPGIEMVNQNNPGDSSILTATFTQTQ